jgi:membrane-associated phospholipid phosphatase
MASLPSAQAFQDDNSIPVICSKQRASSDIQALSNNGRIIWAMIAAMAVATIAGYRITSLSFAWSTFDQMGLCIAICLAVSYCYRRLRPDPWIGFSTEGCAQLMLVLALGSALSYPLATAGFPYRDALLNAADTSMGLDWRAYLHFVNDRPLLCALTSLAYRSMLLQVIVLIITLVVTSRFLRLQQYVLATALALALTLAVFTFMPAGGIFSFLQIQPGEFPNLLPVMTYDQILYLDALRSGQHPLVSEMEGLITFPSFHTVWAILFMWGFYPIKQLRLGAILLNLLVIASTPIQGAHYFVDLIGGAVVAVVAIYGATLSTRTVGVG